MYQPNERVSDFIKRAIATPEGCIVAVLAAGYFCAFIFFDAVVVAVSHLGGEISDDYRLGFIIMPFLLFMVYLQMDITANQIGDRVLTVLALAAVAAAPVCNIFNLL